MFVGTPIRLSISKHLRLSIRLSTVWVAGYALGQVINHQLTTACYPAGLLVDCRGFNKVLKF
jgi:hypothetical protein